MSPYPTSVSVTDSAAGAGCAYNHSHPEKTCQIAAGTQRRDLKNRSWKLGSSDVEHFSNPWRSRLNDEDYSPSTVTVRNDQRDSVVYNGSLLSPGLGARRDRVMIVDPESPRIPSVLPTRAQFPMQVTNTTPADSQIASLKAIFPDFDDAVILSVLESTDFNHDRALDVLLGMNDPSFIPPTLPSAQPANEFQTAPSLGAQRLSQEALDEQLARRLALEEQRIANPPWATAGAEGQGMYQPYQPRRGGRNGWSGQPQGQPQIQGQGGRDTMTEFQEGFNRIAESGKKTFSSIMSKLKAKMQEFDQGQGRSGSQNPSFEQPPQPASSSYSGRPSYAPSQQQGLEQGAYTPPSQYTQPAIPQRQASPSQPTRTNTYPSSPPHSGILRPTAVEPTQSSYYDPNAQGYDLYGDDEDIQVIDKTTPTATATQGSATPPPRTGSSATPPPPSDTTSLPSYGSPVSPPQNPSIISGNPPARSLTPTISSARNTMSGAPGGVDFSKLGLLPKRPISLVRPQSPPVSGGGASLSVPRVAATHSESTATDSSDREPEFVENPFEDHK